MRLRHCAILASLLTLPTWAQQEIKFTVASGHPAASGALAEIRDYFIAEVDKRLAAAGK